MQGPEIDQAAFDEWFASHDAKRVFLKAGRVMFRRPADPQWQADYLVGALRIAFRHGFVAGRLNIRPNGGIVLTQEPAPEIPF